MSCRLGRLAVTISLVAALGAASIFTQAVSAKSRSVRTQLTLVNKGYLTVRSDETYPPMESQNSTTGKAEGADIDLGMAIAKAMGLKGAKFDNVNFEYLIKELTGAHPFDVIMSSMNNTPGRRAAGLAFVNYLKAVEAIVVRKSSSIHANNFLGVCGLTVSVENTTTEQFGLQAANKTCKKKINILGFDTDTEAYQAFFSHESDAYTTDYPVARFYIIHNPTSYRLAGKVIVPCSAHSSCPTGRYYGIGIRKSDTALIAAVKKAYEKVHASGKYLKILKKYHLSQGAI